MNDDRRILELSSLGAAAGAHTTTPYSIVLASFILLLLSFSAYHVGRAYPLTHALVQVLVFGSFLMLGHRYRQVRVRGWSLVVIGANLVTFGSLVEISQFVPFLRSSLTAAGTPFRTFLSQVVGHDTGLLLFAYGLYVWVPAFLSSREVMAELVRACEGQLVHNEKLNALAGLVAGVAHELRNPLTVTLGYSGLLLDRPHDAEQSRAMLREINQAARRCDRISRVLLDFAHTPTYQRAAVRLAAVVDEALHLMAYPLHKAGIAVEQAIPADLPTIHADRDQILQVLVNLINNARQALEHHGGTRRIWIEAGLSGDRVYLRVRDSGPGIATELKQRIFEPFFTTKPAGEGTGLGLPICAGIAKAHGGSLSVTSEPGHGASFTCTLPLAAV